MGNHAKYLNGLAVTSIVFIAIATIPLGIVVTIGGLNTNYNETTITLDPGNYTILELDSSYYHFIQYYVNAGEDVKVTTYHIENYIEDIYSNIDQYDAVKNKKHSEIIFGNDNNDAAIYLVNENDFTISIYYIMVSIPRAFVISAFIFGVIDGFFLLLLFLHTIGYLIKNIFIVPITGGASKYDERKGYDRSARRESYYYSRPSKHSEKETSKPSSAPVSRAEKDISSSNDKTKPSARVTPSTITEAVDRKTRYIPALANISENFIVAKSPKTYVSKNKFINKLHYQYDQTDITERVLILLSVFFFLIGCFTATFWNIFAMPIILAIITAIVMYNSRNRREKLIQIVQGYGAIYIRDLTKILNSPYKVVHQDIWKIINLGLANIAYDVKNDIVFIPGIQKSEQAKKVKHEYSTRKATFPTHQPLSVNKSSSEFDEILSVSSPAKDKEIICPFCEAKNPGDSSFCIKCGASLKPAK
ncbi:MAG: hypothetical protein K9W45_00825 [Candidatus Heimdallarchaeum aukensis]|uniref:Zinc-ribbon domain-containing protein n=1 Tax=Candidatus Heimdallarchaeum aukensis TaxID=2876573 RepID=A0A9Y1BL23_9ARCH|nr:MAG: hypothetical protein K9W45_00825 [Candidatus Heimdallarchaeum aukensis]